MQTENISKLIYSIYRFARQLIRNSPTLSSFKNRVKADIYKTPKYYNEGPRKLIYKSANFSKYFGVDVITILVVPKEQSFNIDIDIVAITQKCSSFVQV
jgi:hypothetical protein